MLTLSKQIQTINKYLEKNIYLTSYQCTIDLSSVINHYTFTTIQNYVQELKNSFTNFIKEPLEILACIYDSERHDEKFKWLIFQYFKETQSEHVNTLLDELYHVFKIPLQEAEYEKDLLERIQRWEDKF